jgi:hypothetical protein
VRAILGWAMVQVNAQEDRCRKKIGKHILCNHVWEALELYAVTSTTVFFGREFER